jgi:endonuclease III-like uncharacterized protein
MGIFGLAKKGLGLLGRGKKVKKEYNSFNSFDPGKKKRLRKENLKVAGVGAATIAGVGAYIAYEYADNLRKYPNTGKNLKRKKD